MLYILIPSLSLLKEIEELLLWLVGGRAIKHLNINIILDL